MVSKSNTNKKIKNIKITPLVKSLIGIAKLPKDFDFKKEYGDYLYNKYLSLK